jgi:hypothetical protein
MKHGTFISEEIRLFKRAKRTTTTKSNRDIVAVFLSIFASFNGLAYKNTG